MVTNQAPNQARVIPLRPPAARPGTARPAPDRPSSAPSNTARPAAPGSAPGNAPGASRQPLWRDLVGGALRRERHAQERTLKDVAEAARISMPYLSELERGRKEASSEVLASAAQALGLSLGDLLSLAQGELVRLTSRTAVRGRGPSASLPNGHTGHTGFNGLCLAA